MTDNTVATARVQTGPHPPFRRGSKTRAAHLRPRHLLHLLPLLIAGVWLYHGLYNKLLDGEPRHLLIVQSVPGLHGAAGWWALVTIGLAEVLLALWVLAGLRPRTCAAVQTAALLAMNLTELTFARHLLLWPAGLVPVNLLFLTLVWISAHMQRTVGWRIGPHLLRRHPFPVRAHFHHSLVLTYAFPRRVLEPLLPPGLQLDTHGDFGFLAVAMVQTRNLRPAFLPRTLAQDFLLTGYRIFVKFRTPDRRTLRGLRILRSDADRWPMVLGGNLLTHYHYRKCTAAMHDSANRLEVHIRTRNAEADVDLTADLSPAAEGNLPDGSPFRTMHEARRFAGPLPWTFDYEPQTHSIIAIRGVRQNWNPRLVPVDLRRLTFLDRPPFNGTGTLASAFHVHDIPYRWERGIPHRLPNPARIRPRTPRLQGALQILRFNWPFYAIGTAMLLLAGLVLNLLPLPSPVVAVMLAGIGLGGFWIVASIVASHWIYDRSALRTWRWIVPALGFIPRNWINLHAGLDESTNSLRHLFPNSQGRVFDFYDPREMSEPSIRRARRCATRLSRDSTSRGGHPSQDLSYQTTPPPPQPVRCDGLPLADQTCDAAMLLLSAHELRRHQSRLDLFRELRRALTPDGRIVLAEHLRDLPNFIAFGPGAFHFHSRRTWLRAVHDAGLAIDRQFRITPFINVFILRRPS